MKTWLFTTSDAKPKPTLRGLISGTHHAVLKEVQLLDKEGNPLLIKRGPPGLVGNPCVRWIFSVLEGPSMNSRLYHETPLAGYFTSRTNPGMRYDADFLTKKMVQALDPSVGDLQNKEVDFDSYIGREVELTITVKEGDLACIWPKVEFARPWIQDGMAGSPAVLDGPAYPEF